MEREPIINQRPDPLYLKKPQPKVGKKVPESNDENVRELALYSYRIIYEIKNQNVFVLAVVHKRKDLKKEDIEQ